MRDGPLHLAVIIGSTREGRVGDRIARWIVAEAGRRDGVLVSVIDIAGFAFPPGYPAEATPQMAAFAAEVERADAFVVVTPEYNHSFPASLKQAIDFAYDEWHAKPVGFVSYGCRSEGLHAVDQLRTVFTALHMVTVRDGVGVDLLDDAGDLERLLGGDAPVQAARVLLDQLCWWGLTLREGRAARPYVS
ncbi:NAD(P)H-dependent oxidoreductase [Dactylosporangium fulvum]|uniref:NAD(P)H-dependent oxidoreductase n=1 Tax=Dactylosporangium fulvum TaxID=53359 RepID=A0ABY5VVG5_9ACTN|nr:NAD(P)H-dependent oxidoreductase [Dactylosporangium fulvum]UWP81255.1 NAD(P)H-dependent oxidoreductase [Dactylosporangium fulvum]